MVRLYKAFVLPHLEYCSPLFLGVGNVEASKMASTNYYILRSIIGYSKTVSYDTVNFSILRMFRIIYVGLAQSWNSLISKWNGCMDPLHFWPAKCGMRCLRQ